MSTVDGQRYLVRRWNNPDAEWGNHSSVEAWDEIEAAEAWAQLQEHTLHPKAELEKFKEECKLGIDLQVRHIASGGERRVRVRLHFVPQYDAVIAAWNKSGEERLEPM